MALSALTSTDPLMGAVIRYVLGLFKQSDHSLAGYLLKARPQTFPTRQEQLHRGVEGADTTGYSA